jgi:hypothetical protein
MILPRKTIDPVDSLISISAILIEILKSKSFGLDDLLEEFNEKYYKKISIEKLILAIDFLYLTGIIQDNNEVIKFNI